MLYSLHDVFISYRRFEDKEKKNDQGTRLAQAIYSFLTSKGLRVFWDDPEMEPGDFEEQLHWQIEHSPNYIFIGTEAAKRFRTGEEDYVAEELKTALRLYRESPNQDDRVVTHVLPWLSKEEREKAEAAGPYPKEIQELTKLHGVEMQGEQLTDKNLSDILKLVTRVNRGNMWNAGYRWYEQSRKPGARFANLSIDRTIMPNAGGQARETARLPIYAHGEQEAAKPLLTKIENTPGHLYLIGEGGIGKTTALYSIMESVYGAEVSSDSVEQLRLNGQVPIFVELSRAPDTYGKLYEGGRSTFIHRAIYQQIRQDKRVKQVPGSAVKQLDEVFTIDPETAVNPIHDLFTEESPAPEYLLLLDGLNEVSRVVIEHREEPEMKSAVVTMILQEIHQLMTECPNVRVILTSRSKEQTNWGDETTMLYLSGVNDDSVKDYLTNAHLSQARIENALNNEKLRDVLRVPLFLTLYASLDGDEELLTQGEILHLFFHQKKKALYSSKARIEKVDEDVDKAASAKQLHRLTAVMQAFILDFILPEIAWRMEQNDLFYIYRIGDEEEANLSSIIEHVLTDEGDTAVCGKYADAFEDYLSDSDAGQDTLSVAEDMIDRLGGRMRKVVDSILNCAVMTLGILQKNGDEYGFIHHHIRDYFAAVYQINRLKLAVYLQKRKKNELARKCLADWKAAPLHAEVRRFIGEALDEAHNAPVCDDEGNWHYVVPEEPCERNLIKRGLDIYRGRFDGEDGYAVWNILEIIMIVRQDLSGVDITNLDLERCEWNGVHLSRGNCRARLLGSKVLDTCFNPKGHTETISSASYSADSQYIVTTSRSAVIIWDNKSNKEVRILISNSNAGYKTAKFSPNGRNIIVASSNDAPSVWNSETGEQIYQFPECFKRLEYVEYSPDGRFVLARFEKGAGSQVVIWDAYSFKTLCIMKHQYHVYSAHFGPNSNTIVSTQSNGLIGLVSLWDLSQKKTLGNIMIKKCIVEDAFFSPNGKYIATISQSTLKLWDSSSLRQVGEIKDDELGIRRASFSPDSEIIMTTFAIEETVMMWNTATLRPQEVLINQSITHDAVFSPDGKNVMLFHDGTASIWDRFTLVKTYTIPEQTKNAIISLMYKPKTQELAAVSEEKTVQVWDGKTNRLLCKIGGPGKWIGSFSYSPDGNYIVCANAGRFAWVLEAKSYKVVGILRGHKNWVNSAVYSLDGKRIMTVSEDKTAIIWNAYTFKQIGLMIGHSEGLLNGCFSPDGRHVLTTSYDETAKLWLSDSFKEVCTLNCDGYPSNSCIFSPDGNFFAVACGRKVNIWDTHDLQIAGSIEHKQIIEMVCFSPDSKKVVTGSRDQKAIIWDVNTCNRIAELTGHNQMINCVAYSPNGEQIATAAVDGTIKIWNASTFKCQHSIHNIHGLEVIGVDLRHIHPDSRLSDEVKERLYEYGAIVDERG